MLFHWFVLRHTFATEHSILSTGSYRRIKKPEVVKLRAFGQTHKLVTLTLVKV